jgi:hypothetical protein
MDRLFVAPTMWFTWEMSKMNREARMEKMSEIHSLERSVKIWEETSIPKFKDSIKYFANELAKGEIEVARLKAQIAIMKKELGGE